MIKFPCRAINVPLYLSSTFCFESPEEMDDYFIYAYGLWDEKVRGKVPKKIKDLFTYSRLGNPTVCEYERLIVEMVKKKGIESSVGCLTTASGLSSLNITLGALLKQGDALLFTNPLYGGSDHQINEYWPKFGVNIIPCYDNDKEKIIKGLKESGMAEKLRVILIETPANPDLFIYDLKMFREIADELSVDGRKVVVVVDNTFLSLLYQNALKFADIEIESATKFLGGFSDLIGGIIIAKEELIPELLTTRTILGGIMSPFTAMLLIRSLADLELRMEKQIANAKRIVEAVKLCPPFKKIYYPGLFKMTDVEQYRIFKQQCDSHGSMIAFDLGSKKKAFAFIKAMAKRGHVVLAVSLGGIEYLITHPLTTTHTGSRFEVPEGLVRLSVGISDAGVIIKDILDSLIEIS